MNKKILDSQYYYANGKENSIIFVLKEFNIHTVLLVTDLDLNKIIYNPHCDGYGGTVTKKTLFLEQSISSGNNLQIVYIPNIDYREENIFQLRELNENIKKLHKEVNTLNAYMEAGTNFGLYEEIE